MTHPNTSSLFRYDIKDDERYDVYDQLIVLFTYRGRDLKSKFDRVIVDKVTKRIILSDVKVVHNMKFFRSQFFNMKYYIQSALYFKAMEWLLQNDWKELYPDYEIMANDEHDSSKFLFVSASYSYTDPHDPLIFGVDQEMINQGIEGWSDSYGNYVPGVDYAIMNIDWHERTGIWTTDMKNYNNNGFNKISGKVTPTEGDDE